MAFYSGFFNSKGLDRTYTAEDFTEYLSSIICNGILDTYGQNFSLTASTVGLRVILGTGKAWINGHYFVNDTRHTIDLAEYQDESLPRYVAISILLDTSENVRSVSLEITPGTPAEAPSLPSFPQSENKARLLVYAVRLNVGATSLTERDWYDYREDKNVCGYCKCILGKCKVTEMQSQLAAITAKINEYNEQVAELTGKVEMLQTKVDDLTGDIVETGSLGENIYYVKYSNGRLLLRGTGATYDYDLGESPFWEDESIKSLVVSEGITAIGDSVFERCANMTSASFPNTLKSIGKRAFFMYTTGGLTSLNLPASVTKIGEKAFTNISASSLVLPETLSELGTYLFMYSNTLQNIRVECAEIPAFCFVKKTITSDYGECEIAVPRDRNGEFRPQVIEKRQTRTDEIEQKIMAMYAKGMSQRDIEDTIREIYGADVSQGMISRITDKILPAVNEWQNRPLASIYPVIFFDGIVFNSRKDNRIITKCIYSVLGINMEGRKEILGTWISENESASFYASICADLKSRGVKDIFIACHDNLTGLCEAITSIFPKTKNQLCIVHQIRNNCKFVPYKDRKAVCADLKKIYGAVNLDDAEYALGEFREKWNGKYPNILKSWDKNWTELTVFFEYPQEIRKIIYTTNAVEGYHRMVRKFTKSKSIFPTDDSIRKVIFLSVSEIEKKWNMPVRDWGLAYPQFMIYFEDRLAA